MSQHSAATVRQLFCPAHLGCSINSALTSSHASILLSQAVPLLRLLFLSSQGFLCVFLLKAKKNNKARAALQPYTRFLCPPYDPACALPSKATLPGIFPADFSQPEGFYLSGGACTQAHAIRSSLIFSEVLLGTFGFKQILVTTRASIKSFKQTQRNHTKRLSL